MEINNNSNLESDVSTTLSQPPSVDVSEKEKNRDRKVSKIRAAISWIA
jgi:hypothetical protein